MAHWNPSPVRIGRLLRRLDDGQVAGAEERATQRLGRLNDTRRRAAVRDVLLSHVLITSLVENVAQIGTGIVLLLVGQSLRAGSFTVGDFARAREQLNFAQGLEKDQLSLARIRGRLDYIRDIENKYYRQQ